MGLKHTAHAEDPVVKGENVESEASAIPGRPGLF